MTVIVAATAAHAGAMAAIHADACPAGERWDAAAFAALLRTPAALGFVAPAGGLILLRAAAGEAEILTLAVLPGARRRGLGRALLARALAGVPPGTDGVFLEVSDRNAAAIALYRAAGFRAVGRRPAYYADGADAWIMRFSCAAGAC